MRIFNNLHYEFKKSIVIIVINFCVAWLITMCVSALVRGCEFSRIPPNGFGSSQIKFEMYAMPDTRISDVINDIEENTDRFVLSLAENDGFIGIYVKNYVPELNMLEGRFLNEKDFCGDVPVAVVAADFKNNCILRDGELYYAYGGVNYRIAGIFEREPNYINPTANLIYALNKEYCDEATVLGGGSLTWTFASPDKRLPGDLVSKYRIRITDDLSDTSFFITLKKAAEAMGGTLLGVILVIAMIVINMINIISEWIYKHKKEISISLLCGGKKNAVFKYMITKYGGVLLTAWAAGSLISVSLITFFKNTLSNFSTSPETIMISLVILFLLSGGICAVELKNVLKKGILEILRR